MKSMLLRFKKIAKKGLLLYYRMLVKLFPVKKNWIVFQSGLGREYGGNPKAVYEELVRQGLHRRYRCHYILNRPSSAEIPKSAKAVRNGRLYYYYVMAVSGVWVSDTRFQNYIIKRKETVYIQTWHGTPLKKLALDMDQYKMAEETGLLEYQEEFRKNALTWDYLLVQNPFSEEIFRRAFAFEGMFLRTGYPRNDILFRNDPMEVRALRQKYGIPGNRKVMLYAPTWRDDAFDGAGRYKFETMLDFSAMQEAFQQDYILLVKRHYTMEEQISFEQYGNFVRSMHQNSDISELYLLSDLLITDYSSVMFDYSILKRPMFFYVYDYEKYRDALRGFYFDLYQEAPGPLACSTAELIRAVRTYRADAYQEAYEAFSAKYHTYDKGGAAGQIVSLIRDRTS